jgi:hypothetical protein
VRCCCGCRYVVARNAAEAARKAAAQWGEGLVLVQVSCAVTCISACAEHMLQQTVFLSIYL